MLIQLNDESKQLAKVALSSHDGLAAKHARILLEASEALTIEEVAQSTSWSTDTIRRILQQYNQGGDSVFQVRPKMKNILFKNFLFTTYEGAEWKYYNKALIHSDYEAHQLAFNTIKRLLSTPNGKEVLEIGAGEGAMAMMLKDAGYNIECVDVGDQEFVPRDIKLRIFDVDKGLKDTLREETYDLVFAIEVFEHLKNPWTFVGEVFDILRPGGHLLITIPNIASFVSRAKFLTDGHFYQFDDPDEKTEYHGHITPLPWYIIEHIFRATGFKNVTTKQTRPMSLLCFESLKSTLRSAIRLIAYPFSLVRHTPNGRTVMICGSKPVL